jgi:hypothetical protein
MKSKVDEFVQLFPHFHNLEPQEQILRLVYFHTIEERRETVSQAELSDLFNFAELSVPKRLGQILGYLCGKAKKLRCKDKEYSLERAIRLEIEAELDAIRGVVVPPKVVIDAIFEFPGKAFKDAKIVKLLEEAGKCHAMGCWNACGILIRIIVERTLDALDPAVKAKSGLKDKINCASSAPGLPISKSMQEGLKALHGAKLVGDVAAHHSSTLLEEGDINGVIPTFRMLIKEVKTI